MLTKPPVPYDLCVANVKAVVAAFNQQKTLVGAFSVITNLRMELFEALENMLDGYFSVDWPIMIFLINWRL